MKRKIILLLALTGTMFYCQEQPVNPGDSGNETTILTLKDDAAYSSALSSLTKGTKSDKFTIKSVTIDDTSLKMLIEVQYGGGCKKHDFKLVWPDAIIMIYPPKFSVILNHDANGDMCEALPTSVLEIDLKASPLGFDYQSIRDMTVTVINGSNPDEKVESI